MQKEHSQIKINQVKLFTCYNFHVISYTYSPEILLGLDLSSPTEVFKPTTIAILGSMQM